MNKTHPRTYRDGNKKPVWDPLLVPKQDAYKRVGKQLPQQDAVKKEKTNYGTKKAPSLPMANT